MSADNEVGIELLHVLKSLFGGVLLDIHHRAPAGYRSAPEVHVERGEKAHAGLAIVLYHAVGEVFFIFDEVGIVRLRKEVGTHALDLIAI